MAGSSTPPSIESRQDQCLLAAPTISGRQHANLSEVSRKPVPDKANHQSYTLVEDDDGDVEEHAGKVQSPTTHEVKEEDSILQTLSDSNGCWPVEPQRLQKRGLMKHAGLFLDLLLTVVPAAFLVFGFCAISLNEKPLSDYGSNILEGLKFGPSIFPIAFAAIVGRMMRCIAQRNVERGANLGLLEQLVGSQSISSTLQRMVMLERYGLLSIIIVLVWLLSPLGGQSSLRILEPKASSVQFDSSVRYLAINDVDLSQFTTGWHYAIGSMNAMFQASLLSSYDVKVSPVDSWNNVKIPMLDDLSPWLQENTDNPWIPVTVTPSATSYAALTGVIIDGLNSTGKSEFTIETSYMQFQCSDGKEYYPSNESSYADAFPYSLSVHNVSDPFSGDMYGSSMRANSSFFFDYGQNLYQNVSTQNGSFEEVGQIFLLYGTLDGGFRPWNPLMLFNCSLSTSRVEAAVACDGPACAVEKVRRSTLLSPERSRLTPFTSSTLLDAICSFLDFSTGSPDVGLTTPLELYVRGDDMPYTHYSRQQLTFEPSVPSIASVDTAIVARRLSILLNTAWQISLAPLGISQGTYVAGTQNYSGEYLFERANATITVGVQLYSINKTFTCIFLATTFLLQIFAIVGFVLKLCSAGPDILGYVSTQTRDNILFPELVGGSTLDGLERARLLKDMKVQLSDIQAHQAVGHIAFTRAGENVRSRLQTVGVEKDRYYS